jgi:hypothetical protein
MPARRRAAASLGRGVTFESRYNIPAGPAAFSRASAVWLTSRIGWWGRSSPAELTHLAAVPLGIVAADGRRAGVGSQQGGEDADGGRLAPAVRAEEPGHPLPDQNQGQGQSVISNGRWVPLTRPAKIAWLPAAVEGIRLRGPLAARSSLSAWASKRR